MKEINGIKGIPIKKYYSPQKRAELGILTTNEKNAYDQKVSELEAKIAALKCDVANKDSIIASKDQVISSLQESSKKSLAQAKDSLNASLLELSLTKENSKAKIELDNRLMVESKRRIIDLQNHILTLEKDKEELKSDKEDLRNDKKILTNKIKSLKGSLAEYKSMIDSSFMKEEDVSVTLCDPPNFQNSMIAPQDSNMIGESAIDDKDTLKSEYYD